MDRGGKFIFSKKNVRKGVFCGTMKKVTKWFVESEANNNENAE
jgi:hypothetical protein